MLSPTKCLLAAAWLLAALPCFAQVDNDDCSSATVLQVSPDPGCGSGAATAGATLYATASGLGLCSPEANDVWYAFTATGPVHDVRVFNVVNADYYYYPNNFLLEVFSGSCDGTALQHLYCIDNSSIRCGDLIPGNTYYLRVTNPNGWRISFEICVGTPLPPPGNDICANAIVLAVDPDANCDTPVAGSTENASASPFPACPECFPHEDVWYSFTATQANHVVALTDAKGIGQDGSSRVNLETYTGGCGSLVSLNRNKEIYNKDSLVFNDLTAGQTYYLRLFKNLYYPYDPVQFNICVTTPPPPHNDECAGAISIVPDAGLDCGGSVGGSLYGAVVSGTDCQSVPVSDVWYQFTATSPSHRIIIWPTGSTGYGFEVYGGDCTNRVSLVCAQGDNPGRTLSNLSVGSTYYLRVFSPTNTAFDFQVCIMTLPPPPGNDECAGALPLQVNAGITCDLNTPGSTLGATSSLPACAGTENTHDVWYSFEATSVSHRLLFYVNNVIFGDYSQIGYVVYQGDCGQLSSLACGHIAPNYNPEVLLGGLTPGHSYFVRVYSIAGSNHEFNLCVQTLPPPPANADCAQAETLTSTPMPNCTAPVSGNTAGVVTTEQAHCFSGKDLWYTFTATSTTHIVQISNVYDWYGYNNNYGYWLELYEGTDCNSPAFINCYTSPGTVYLNHLTIGKTYYLRWGSDAYMAHTFQICLKHFAPPANDECAGARPLTVHGNLDCYYSAQGSTAGSSASLLDACFNNPDVWFRFTAIQTTQRVVVSNIKSVENGSFVSLQAELFGGPCGNLNSLYCWPSFTSDPGTLFIGDLTPGQTYYLRFSNPEDIPVGFIVCALSPPKPPANDNCAHATVLTPEANEYCTPVSGATEYATPTPGLPLPTGNAEGDVWYTFAASETNHIVSLSNVYGYHSNKCVVEVYSSACGAFHLLTSQIIHTAGNCYLSTLTPGEMYHVRVLPESEAYIWFNICIGTPPAPVNDECVNALPLPVGTGLDCNNQLSASTYGATQSRPDCDGNAATDIWYQFTATDATYRFDIYNYFDNSAGGGIEVFTGDCDQLVSLFCRSLAPQSTVIQQAGFVPGTSYYLRLWSQPNSVQQWNICARALPPAPANDECSGAAFLTVDAALPCDAPVLGTTLSASQSEPGCASSAVQDVWYAFVATSVSNLLDVSVLKYYFGSYNAMGYQLFSGDCGNTNSLLCQDYYNSNRIILPDLVPGQTYYLRLYSYTLEANDFSICLTAMPSPQNDACDQAIPVIPNSDLSCNTVYPGTTVSATAGPGFTEPDVWYSFTASGSMHFFQLLNVQTLLGYLNGLGCQIYRGSTCGDVQLFGTVDPAAQTRITGLVPGETYFIRVFSVDAVSAHSFELCIQTPPPPPVNDDCAGALSLTPNAGLDCIEIAHGSTAGVVDAPGSLRCYWAGKAYDVWYQFTATAPNHRVQASNITPVTGSGSGIFEMAAFQSADCVNFTELGCTGSNYPLYLSNLTPGETYYIAVSSGTDVSHEFDICITTYPVPPNDLCENAIPLAVAPTPNCDQTTPGTTVSAGPSGETSCGPIGNDVWYTFTATQAAHIITVNNVSSPIGGYSDYFGVEVYRGDCGQLQNIDCRYNVNYAIQFIIGDLVPGTLYRIRVGYGAVNFNICVGTPDLPPANDACAGAVVLAVSPDETCTTPFTSTTEYATPSSVGPVQNTGNNTQLNDVWYRFTATQANHAVMLSNVVNQWANYLNLDVYSGDCDALIKVSSQPYYLGDQYVWLLTNLIPGTNYYVRVYEGTPYPSTFDICILSMPLPANDECAGATPLVINQDLTCQQETSASTYGATQSAPGCTGEAANDIWFQFTADVPSCRLDIKTTTYGSSGTFGVEILEGPCSAPVVVLPCATYYYDNVLTLHALTPGNTYFIRLFVPAADVKDFTICLRNLPEPPSNDECAQATVIQANSGFDCDVFYTGSTLGAGQSTGVTCGYSASDVWYRFVATSTGHIIDVTTTGHPYGTAGSDPAMEFYIGDDCGNLTTVSCIPYSSLNNLIFEGLTVGATYFIRIFSVDNGAHDFSLCIRTLPPAPANNQCSGAVTVVPSPDMQCAQPVAGTTAGLSEGSYFSYYPTMCYAATSLWYHFKATASAHFIQLQNVTKLYGDDYLRLALFKGGCDTYNFQHLYCTEQREIFATNLTPGADYYILVGGFPKSGISFDLCVLTPTQPDNDHCAGAVTLPVSPDLDCIAKVSGSTLGATGTLSPGCYSGPDVLYSFVATGTEHYVNFSNTYTTSGYQGPFCEVLSGDCSDWSGHFGCFDAVNSTLVSGLEPGKTYYLRVGSHYPAYFNFDICISTPQPDLDLYTVFTYSAGCKPGNDEKVEVRFQNQQAGSIPAGAVQFTLTVSGANNGVYGPIANPSIIANYGNDALTFSGIDLSNPGESQITVTATLPNDIFPDNNSSTITFSSLPLFTYYRDADADGYGNPAEPFESCYPTNGYVTDNTDCDDNANWINPGAAEYCNGFDDNCDGLTDAEDPALSDAPPAGITCPGDFSLATDPGSCSAVASYTVSATDNCGYTLTQTGGLSSGESFPAGATLNSFTVVAPDGSSASCAFTVTVEKTADPNLLFGYTVIGLNDVFLKNNIVGSGGVGVVNAGKKARLQAATAVTAANTFVKAPVLELTGGSQVATSITGQLAAGLLPVFKPNSTPTNNNLTIPNNSAPVTLTLDSYSILTVGTNTTITFSGKSSVRVRELILKEGAKVLFDQNTELLIEKTLAIGRSVGFNSGGAYTVQCFTGKNITVNTGAQVVANLYTLQDLRLEKATAVAPIAMTGQFIANNVYAEDFANWNWDPSGCPFNQTSNRLEQTAERNEALPAMLGQISIAPNPATTQAQVFFELESDTEVTLHLLDATGRPVQTGQFAGFKGANQYLLRLDALPAGMYSVQVLAQGQIRVGKLVVARL